MANRLHVLLDHLRSSTEESEEIRALKRRLALSTLQSQFLVSKARLKQCSEFMVLEMHSGLAAHNNSTLRMLPSYVYKRATTGANGVFYALDLGGTNFRVIRLQLKNGHVEHQTMGKFVIPEEHMQGTSEGLFNFIASSVGSFLHEKGHDENKKYTVPLGFTFSFPVQQTAVNSGTLIKWTKGFKTAGVEGRNVVELLQNALNKAKTNMKVVALCNDTVGTLIARYFSDPHTEVGVILGTGSNACYWERAELVKKEPDVCCKTGQETVINMEFGNFDSGSCHVLPVTSFDEHVDAGSINPGAQRLEKMVSGYYLGEIARTIIVEVSRAGILPPVFQEKLRNAYKFETAHTGAIAADRVPGLPTVKSILTEVYHIDGRELSKGDVEFVRQICFLVCYRAAQLAGMAVSAILLKNRKFANATVAIDGSVYEKTPGFKHWMERTVKMLLGEDCDIRLVLQGGGSGIGAGFIAALT